MMTPAALKKFKVAPRSEVMLKDYTTDWTQTKEGRKVSGDAIKDQAAEMLDDSREKLSEAQELLYASDTHSVLIVLQAMDAAGKDGTIQHVMSGVNPQGCQVFSFKKPSVEELDHNFLWRYMKALPERGRIGVFNRSYYEDVLVVKVHPEWLGPGSPAAPEPKFWKKRYEDINNFEKHLSRNGTLVLKFFLHLSKEEQRQRFLDRLNQPEKNWKFNVADVAEREHWDAYQHAFEAAISATSTKKAPWYVVPADNKHVARAIVAEIITRAIGRLDLEYPNMQESDLAALAAAKVTLEAQKP